MHPPPVAREKYLLLVEDEPDIRVMYTKLFTNAGYHMAVAKDGEEAWEILNTHEPFDLILLDVVLPRRDGFELLRDIRKHPTLHSRPVILLTNLAQEVDRREGVKLGATDYIVKAHTDPKDLLVKVGEYIT